MKDRINELKADILNTPGHTNRLKILQDAGIEKPRKHGLKVYGNIVEPRIFEVLDGISRTVSGT